MYECKRIGKKGNRTSGYFNVNLRIDNSNFELKCHIMKGRKCNKLSAYIGIDILNDGAEINMTKKRNQNK